MGKQKKNGRAGLKGCLVGKDLAYKHKDLSLNPRTYVKKNIRVDEMARRSRALAAPEVLSSIPSNHLVVHNHQ